MLEMVHLQWNYCCNIVHKQEEYGLRIKHREWLQGQVHIYLAKGTESMGVEDCHLVQITFRELWAKGVSNKRICLCAVQIARGKDVDDRERFSGKIWKQKREQVCGNTTITNKMVRRS